MATHVSLLQTIGTPASSLCKYCSTLALLGGRPFLKGLRNQIGLLNKTLTSAMRV